MANDLEMRPAPFTPADCDLRGLEYMPLFGDRLFGSETWIKNSPEGKVAALRLWCHAFGHERPAASLPNNEMLLAQYAGYGVSVKAWRRVMLQALRGWTLCSDGRWHHEFLSSIARRVWAERLRNRKKQADWRARQGLGDGDVTVTPVVSEPKRGRLRNAVSEVKVKHTLDVVVQNPSSARAGFEGASFSDPEQLQWVEAIEGAMGAPWTSQNPMRWGGFPELVRTWREAKFNLESEVIPTIRSAIESCGKIPDGPRYFDKALQNLRLRLPRTGSAKVARAGVTDFDPERTRWVQRVRVWKRDGTWRSDWGPEPGQPGCGVPANLLDREATSAEGSRPESILRTSTRAHARESETAENQISGVGQ